MFRKTKMPFNLGRLKSTSATKYQYLLTNVESSRKTYEEFKTDDLQDKDTISIVDDFKSDDFEKF